MSTSAMHTPIKNERHNSSLPECVEIADVTFSETTDNSESTLNVPCIHQSQIESPGAVCTDKSSDEIEKTIDLFEKTVGYAPQLNLIQGNRADKKDIMQRGISWAKTEKRVSLLVIIVILLDTGLLAFEFENNDKAQPQPQWIYLLNWIFLLVYSCEVGFRLHISTPTSSFFRKRFYVLDLLIVVICLVLQVVSAMSTIASAIRAIRLLRFMRIAKLLKFLRIFTRILETWHARNKQKNKVFKGTNQFLNIKLKVKNSKLEALLARKKLLGSVKVVGQNMLEPSGDQLEIQELFKIVKTLKEQDDRLLFSWTDFSMEWLSFLII